MGGGHAFCVFFFNDTATTEIYTLSLHDALPICSRIGTPQRRCSTAPFFLTAISDRKSTRLNSSHGSISYAVFCLKKKNNHEHANLYHGHQPDAGVAPVTLHTRDTA